jgi:hypothetical protein
MRAKRAPRSPMNDFLNFVQFLKFPCLSFPKNPFFNFLVPQSVGGDVAGFLLTAAGTLGGLPSALKLAPELVKLVPGGVSGVQFLGFIHFPRKRTLTGWAVLFAMGKHTSKEFLYDREHVRVWKCRKTGTKVRSKSGPKTGPSRCPKHRKHRYTGKSSLQRGQKRSLKSSPKTTPK